MTWKGGIITLGVQLWYPGALRVETISLGEVETVAGPIAEPRVSESSGLQNSLRTIAGGMFLIEIDVGQVPWGCLRLASPPGHPVQGGLRKHF